MANCTDIKIYKDGEWRSIKYKKIYASGGWQDANKAFVYCTGNWYKMTTATLELSIYTIKVDYWGRVYEGGYNGDDAKIDVASNEYWTAEKNFDWVTFLEVDYGNNPPFIIMSEFAMNYATTPRTGIVTVTTESGLSKQITVIQDAKPNFYLTVDVDSFSFDYEGASNTGNDSFNISSNESWTITKSSRIKLVPTSLTGTGNALRSISMLLNIRDMSYNGNITIKSASGIVRTISITQDAGIGLLE